MSERARRLERMFDAGIFAGSVMVRHFWCNECQAFTRVEAYTASDVELILGGDTVSPTCGKCGEAYQCDECGFEIDQEGNCLREEGHDA